MHNPMTLLGNLVDNRPSGLLPGPALVMPSQFSSVFEQALQGNASTQAQVSTQSTSDNDSTMTSQAANSQSVTNPVFSPSFSSSVTPPTQTMALPAGTSGGNVNPSEGDPDNGVNLPSLKTLDSIGLPASNSASGLTNGLSTEANLALNVPLASNSALNFNSSGENLNSTINSSLSNLYSIQNETPPTLALPHRGGGDFNLSKEGNQCELSINTNTSANTPLSTGTANSGSPNSDLNTAAPISPAAITQSTLTTSLLNGSGLILNNKTNTTTSLDGSATVSDEEPLNGLSTNLSSPLKSRNSNNNSTDPTQQALILASLQTMAYPLATTPMTTLSGPSSSFEISGLEISGEVPGGITSSMGSTSGNGNFITSSQSQINSQPQTAFQSQLANISSSPTSIGNEALNTVTSGNLPLSTDSGQPALPTQSGLNPVLPNAISGQNGSQTPSLSTLSNPHNSQFLSPNLPPSLTPNLPLGSTSGQNTSHSSSSSSAPLSLNAPSNGSNPGNPSPTSQENPILNGLMGENGQQGLNINSTTFSASSLNANPLNSKANNFSSNPSALTGNASSTVTGSIKKGNSTQTSSKQNSTGSQQTTGAINGSGSTASITNNTPGNVSGNLPTNGATLDPSLSGVLPTAIGNTPSHGDVSASASVFTPTPGSPVSQVAEGTIYSSQNGPNEVIIRMNPDNLGEVRVSLTSHGPQDISARFIASTPETAALLNSQVDTLRQSLEAQGLHVDRLSVFLAGSAASGHDSRSNQDSSQQQAFSQGSNSQNAFSQDSGSQNSGSHHSGSQNSFGQSFNSQNQDGSQAFNSSNGQYKDGEFKQNFAQNPAMLNNSQNGPLYNDESDISATGLPVNSSAVSSRGSAGLSGMQQVNLLV